MSEEDSFASIDELITQMGTNSCSANEYINGDNTFPVCIEFDDDTWNESFLASKQVSLPLLKMRKQMERRKILTYNHLPPYYVATPERQYSHWTMSKLF